MNGKERKEEKQGRKTVKERRKRGKKKWNGRKQERKE